MLDWPMSSPQMITMFVFPVAFLVAMCRPLSCYPCRPFVNARNEKTREPSLEVTPVPRARPGTAATSASGGHALRRTAPSSKEDRPDLLEKHIDRRGDEDDGQQRDGRCAGKHDEALQIAGGEAQVVHV